MPYINPTRRMAIAANFWDRLKFYARFTWRWIVLRRPEPLIYGIAVTDRCNLRCLGCHVSNTGRRDMAWDELVRTLRNAWSRGFRDLYLSGGEPMLWRDGEHTLEDAIAQARRIGFFHVHVYTNGTLGLDTSADLAWVSMDGLPSTFEMRRGCHFAQVERAVRESRHLKIAIIYVIDRNTASGIEPFLRWVHETHFPVVGVMFYFHTPYYGHDELFLTARGARADHRPAPRLHTHRFACHQLTRRSTRAQVRRLAEARTGGFCRRCRWGVCVLPRVRRHLRRLRLCRLHRAHRISAPAPQRAARYDEVLVKSLGHRFSQVTTRAIRRYLVGPAQRWVFEPPARDWTPSPIERTSLYLHVPFCCNCCPYCPYTKVPYDEARVEPYTRAALAEVDWWANTIGPAEITSVYIGGGTPTLALGSITRVLARVRERFRLTGDICIETNPADVDRAMVRRIHEAGVTLVSLGVQSFRSQNLATLGRRYAPSVAERALALLAQGGFVSVNADLMFALPGQSADERARRPDPCRTTRCEPANDLPTFHISVHLSWGVPPPHGRAYAESARAPSALSRNW